MNDITFISGYVTPSFCDIFLPAEDESYETSYDKFRAMFNDSGIPLKISEENLKTLFYLLYAKHGSDPIAGTDVNQFKYDLQSRIFMYGPAWEKRLKIQSDLIALTEEDILKGGEAIYNSASAPGTSKDSLLNSQGKLGYLNGQNTTEYRKSKMEGYANLLALIETDVTNEFLSKFKDLFTVVMLRAKIPGYITYQEEE